MPDISIMLSTFNAHELKITANTRGAKRYFEKCYGKGCFSVYILKTAEDQFVRALGEYLAA